MFIDLHEKIQKQIKAIEKKRIADERKRRAKSIFKNKNNDKIVGFANPLHDALFKLAVMGVRHIQKHGLPKVRIKFD